ncbi:hypothetical protein PV325_004117 [Microctonus aethiopoides]|nr:hypothetical protein PV325_004117 [Microctonus aethiopoides]KAK0091312.1 hypothetical protein PV326_003412 [Microctonus aethiopoides]
MNQQCKVCGEPAAGFHFGAFTCEGCKSFFGRSYNNLSSITECKNSGECIINKKNRTACKACRLRKCLLVGMSKSGSRYGRRSNWFKIHCLLQEQQQEQQQRHQQQQQQHQQNLVARHQAMKNSSSPSSIVHHQTTAPRTKDDTTMLNCLEEYKNSISPSISSPESHNSDSSIEISERRAAYGLHPGFRPLHPHLPPTELSTIGKEMMNLPLGFHLGGMSLIPPTLLPPPNLSIFTPYHLYTPPHHHHHLHHSTNLMPNSLQNLPIGSSNTITTGLIINDNNIATKNNNSHAINHNDVIDNHKKVSGINKRCYLDTMLKGQRDSLSQSSVTKKLRLDESTRSTPDPELPPQDNPIDLSMKTMTSDDSDSDDNIDLEENVRNSPIIIRKSTPIDLTTRS